MTNGIPSTVYETFLAVTFGFCYASALLPLVRLMEAHKTSIPQSQSETTVSIGIPHFIRGILTIVGLACLFGWYAVYFRRFYPEQLPPEKVLLDWVSIGLFAVAANWWDSREVDESIYCVMQAAAVAVFGGSCGLALWTDGRLRPDTTPLVRAIYWCLVLVGCYAFGRRMCFRAKIIFTEQNSRQNQTCKLIRSAVGAWLIISLTIALLAFITMLHVEVGTLPFTGREAAAEVVLASLAFIVTGWVSVSIVDAKNHLRWLAVIMTYLPMAALIIVTIFNSNILFGK